MQWLVSGQVLGVDGITHSPRKGWVPESPVSVPFLPPTVLTLWGLFGSASGSMAKLHSQAPMLYQRVKEIGDIKGTFHARMGTIKDRNGMDLTEVEDIKKRWHKYLSKLHRRLNSI